MSLNCGHTHAYCSSPILVRSRVTNRPDFLMDCPDFISPVQNEMNTHSGRRKVRKFYKLRNLLLINKSEFVCVCLNVQD
jgi:hypothetical protein